MNASQEIQEAGSEGSIIANIVAAPSLQLDTPERIERIVIRDNSVGFTARASSFGLFYKLKLI